jgi:KaiC/GvpD/RAD55 family RecA-like ATPase
MTDNPSPAAQNMGATPPPTPEEADAESRQAKARERFAKSGLHDHLAGELERLESPLSRLKTGWERLDAALGGGLEVPSLTILGAAPKSGKSTWAQIVAERHAEAGGAVFYLDLENGRRRFLRRMLCRRARLGPSQVAKALRDSKSGTFTSREEVDRWNEAKDWIGKIGPDFALETNPNLAAESLEALVAEAKEAAKGRPLLVVVDSLQRLPVLGDDRRLGVDRWLDRLERLRNDQGAAVLVISELKRSQGGKYEAHESAFKESGRIEYIADLALTLTRPTADEDKEATASLRVELCREADADPRGEVATYRPLFPWYGLEEAAPERVERKQAEKSGRASEPPRVNMGDD